MKAYFRISLDIGGHFTHDRNSIQNLIEDAALPGRKRLWTTAGELLQLLGIAIDMLEIIGHFFSPLTA